MKQHIHIFIVKLKLYMLYILINQWFLNSEEERKYLNKGQYQLEVMGLHTEKKLLHLIMQIEQQMAKEMEQA